MYILHTYICRYVIYISYLPPVIIHLELFMNHLKINLRFLLEQKSNHFILESLS